MKYPKWDGKPFGLDHADEVDMDTPETPNIEWLDKLFHEHNAMIYNYGLMKNPNMSRRTQNIKKQILAHISKIDERHNKELMRLAEDTLELLKAVTPARPEDLTQSQWYGIADALLAAVNTLENGLNDLQNKQLTKGKRDS